MVVFDDSTGGQMKKFRVTKYFTSIFLLALIILVPCFALWLYALFVLKMVWLGTIFTLVFLFAIIYDLYQLLWDVTFAKIGFDHDGVVCNFPFRKYRYSWSEFSDWDIIPVGVDTLNNATYWVYFSDRKLTHNEKQNFLNKTRKKKPALAYFQYNTKIFQELLKYAPECICEVLKEKEKHLLENISFVEKIYNR